eukprot:CAMPEP_0178404748 /NCGR_PEP_ID=MMETSP0689_2-20121128/18047_1 /TAXON_ID=160604 /ORGANISM="Amphidinium massartii, Strain CS-259" /LENGTH=103 /DNA_ID=CAMNT_0020025749 /DNA_START=38 /DNA_END=346 /DNA_ORIENTATION=-
MTTKVEKLYLAKDWDQLTAAHPHMDDPRFMQMMNHMNNCYLRFYQFTRCARELGEENTRCKYQYYRAQCSCPEAFLEDWMEHRARGSCHMDILPDRSTLNMRQ